MLNRRHFIGLSGLSGLGLLGGCGSDEATAFVPGIEPLEASTAGFPASTSGQQYPESLVTVTGVASGYEWVHGRAYVAAPLARVFEAMSDPDVITDRRRVSEYSVTPDVEPMYLRSFRVRNIVRDVITLQFDMDYRFAVYDGPVGTPTSYIVRYQKVWGSSLLSVLRGSVILRESAPGVSSLELVRHIKAVAAGRTDAEQYLRDFYASVRARIQGMPLPTYG
ncbi:MAG: hypothetical protein JNK72_21735 [Myxococcales bacterium]|nr:hypothetical protein [Myxococcales bacterium]